MSSDDESEAVYKVERILADKKNEEGITVYLVKWQGYPDEECTWEPRSSFNSTESVDIWEQQKAAGDILDAFDLGRIQEQIDRFQARQADSSVSDYGVTENGDGFESELEELDARPNKRKKLGTPPPTKKGIARPKKYSRIRGRPALRASKPSPPPRDMSPAKQRQPAPPLHRPPDQRPVPVRRLTGENARSKDAIATKKPTTSNVPDPPTKFYGIERKEKRMLPASSTTAAATVNTAKRTVSNPNFKNLRHMNNAHKLQREERAPDPTTIVTFAPDEDPPTRSNLNAITAAEQSLENDSWLFFSDDEARESAKKESATETGTPTVKVEKGSDSLVCEIAVDRAENPPSSSTATKPAGAARKVPTSATERPPLSVSVPAVARKEKSQRQENLSESANIEDIRPDHALEQIQAHVVDPAEAAAQTIQSSGINVAGGKNPTTSSIPMADEVMTDSPVEVNHTEGPDEQPRPRRNSLFSKTLPAAIARSQQVAPATLLPTSPATVASTIAASAEAVQRQVPSSYVQSAPDTARLVLPRGQINRASNGRQWRKGDILLDIYLPGRAAGTMKVLHVPWQECGRQIVELKQKNEAQLPIYFNQTVSRAEYDQLSKQNWFSYIGCGAVEPFYEHISNAVPSTTQELLTIAEYLERHGLAALWEHPTKDLMMVMYSCESPPWQDLVQMFGRKPIREGQPRVYLAMRQKFRKPGLDSLAHVVQRVHAQADQNQRQKNTDPQRSTIHDRDNERRGRTSRRGSITSTGPRPFSQVRQRSQSRVREHIGQEMVASRDRRTQSMSRITDRPRERSTNHPTERRREQSTGRSVDPRSTVPSVKPIDPDAMKIDDPHVDIPLEQSLPSADTMPLGPFPGLSKLPTELGYYAARDSTQTASSSIWVLLAYQKCPPGRAQDLKNWFVQKGVPSTNILDMPSTMNWDKFGRHLLDHPCILMFDQKYPIIKLTNLSKHLEQHPSLLCWEIDYYDPATSPLKVKRLFPLGRVVAMTEGCFLIQPENTLKILRWFQVKIREPYPASKLVLPPKIIDVLQDQATLSRNLETKKQFLDMICVIEELMSSSQFSPGRSPGTGEDHLSWSVVQTEWSDVYKGIPEGPEALSAKEQIERDVEKDERFLGYFGTWSLLYLHYHRHFIGFTIKDKLKNQEHIRFKWPKTFLDSLEKAKKSTKSRGSTSRPVSRQGSAELSAA